MLCGGDTQNSSSFNQNEGWRAARERACLADWDIVAAPLSVARPSFPARHMTDEQLHREEFEPKKKRPIKCNQKNNGRKWRFRWTFTRFEFNRAGISLRTHTVRMPAIVELEHAAVHAQRAYKQQPSEPRRARTHRSPSFWHVRAC